MIALSVALLLSVSQDTDVAQGPKQEAIDAAVSRIQVALRGKERGPKLDALDAAIQVPASRVVKAVLVGLRDDETEVKRAAIQSLRWLDHPDALFALHRTLAKDRKVKRDDELTAAVLKAIGQHADLSSIDVLTKRLFESKHYASTHARLLGLGRIREKASVDALIESMKRADQHVIARHMDHFRLSLLVLTGTDRGPSADAWQDWWQKRRKDFVVSERRGALPREEGLRWTHYWGIEYDYGRTQRRADRGNDPDRRRTR